MMVKRKGRKWKYDVMNERMRDELSRLTTLPIFEYSSLDIR